MAGTDPTVTVTDAPGPEVGIVLGDCLNQHNRDHAGYWDQRPLAVLVRDPDTGAVLGGLTGRTSLGLAFIDLVYLPVSLRGRGYGARILQEAEAEARRRGGRARGLCTLPVQAPGFYARHGWEEFGRIECDPPGTARVFFRKTFTPADSPDGSGPVISLA